MQDRWTTRGIELSSRARPIACCLIMIVTSTLALSACTRSESDDADTTARTVPQHDSAILPDAESPTAQHDVSDAVVFELAGLRIPVTMGSQEGQHSSSSMRAAEWTLPASNVDGAEADSEDATLIVYYFGDTGAGTIEANIARWLGQIAQPDGSDSRTAATITEHEVNGLPATTVDVAGNYVAETFPGSGERVNKQNWRMVATIVQSPAGPYYFRLLGPEPIVSGWHDAYRGLLDDVHPAN